MKHDGGRRILLAALVVCLGLLVFLFARRSVDAQMQIERRHPRVNGDLYMTVDGDSVATIHGAGKLYDADVRAMLNSVGLHEDTVEDIIVGDRVTVEAVRELPNSSRNRLYVRCAGTHALQVGVPGEVAVHQMLRRVGIRELSTREEF